MTYNRGRETWSDREVHKVVQRVSSSAAKHQCQALSFVLKLNKRIRESALLRSVMSPVAIWSESM